MLPMMQLVAAELAQNLAGASAIVDRLAEVLFVQAVRAQVYSPQRDQRPNWLRALADPQIGESLRLMHANPGHKWTVPELARRVSMSRSAFATRFRSLVDDTPLNHLIRWRMYYARYRAEVMIILFFTNTGDRALINKVTDLMSHGMLSAA